MDGARLLVIAGSSRSGSLNLRLASFSAQRAGFLGMMVTQLDLRGLQLPVYDGDVEIEAGVPQGAHQLRDAIQAADALLVVTPEYNGFPTPLLLNAFDWLSRLGATEAHAAGLGVTANKVAGLLSASPGPAGALRSMNFLRQYLQMAFGMIVVPQQFALGRAHEAFDANGGLKDTRAQQSVDGVLQALSRLAGALRVAG